MVSVDQFRRGLAAYADSEILNRLPYGTFKRVLIGGTIAIALQRGFDNLIGNPVLLSLGIFSSDKMIDVDLLRSTILEQMPPDGISFNAFGFDMRFRADDIESVYRCIMEC